MDTIIETLQDIINGTQYNVAPRTVMQAVDGLLAALNSKSNATNWVNGTGNVLVQTSDGKIKIYNDGTIKTNDVTLAKVSDVTTETNRALAAETALNNKIENKVTAYVMPGYDIEVTSSNLSYFMKQDGTSFDSITDFNNYVGEKTSAYNTIVSTSYTINLFFSDYYLIVNDKETLNKYRVIINGTYFTTGDDLFIPVEDTPDRWIGNATSSYIALYPYEGKVNPNIYQTKTDNNLQTTSKQIVGAINELNSGKQSKTDNSLTTTAKTIVGAINELDLKLSETNRTLYIYLQTEIGQTVFLNNVQVEIQDGDGNVLATKTTNSIGQISIELPLNQSYKVIPPSSLTYQGTTLFNPQAIYGTSMVGALTTNATAYIKYDNTSTMTTLQSVHAFLQTDLPLETKKAALVSSSTNDFTVDIDLYGNGTSSAKTQTMPHRIVDVKVFNYKEDGVVKQQLGALMQPKFIVKSNVWDDREQEECTNTETFIDDMLYFSADTTGIGDKAFTLLSKGTDYNVGDNIGTWKTSHSKFVFKNNLKNNLGNLVADASMIKYGCNVLSKSGLWQWMNGEDTDWFVKDHIGDYCSFSDQLGYKSYFKDDVKQYILQDVEWEVYERTGFELPNNKLYGTFNLFSGSNLAGSVNANEGQPFDYWLYKNGGEISNAENANRTMTNNSGTAQYTWTRSPSRSYSFYAWRLYPSGILNYYFYCYDSYGVAPLFVLI